MNKSKPTTDEVIKVALANFTPLTIEQYIHAREEYLGYCVNCGEEYPQCEPDADGYYCHACDSYFVQGVENLLMFDLVE